MTKALQRCSWVSEHALYPEYHDNVWGVPQRKPHELFEMLCLGGQQAGLSWIQILKKREKYREYFLDFNPELISLMTETDLARILLDPGIIRNKRKLQSIIENAKACIKLQENENFSDFIWNFVDGKPLVNYWDEGYKTPATSEISDAMAKVLKANGFKFVGSTICYAFMQTCGLVNDHYTTCFRHSELMSYNN